MALLTYTVLFVKWAKELEQRQDDTGETLRTLTCEVMQLMGQVGELAKVVDKLVGVHVRGQP